MEEPQLVTQAQQGNAGAFAELVGRYQTPIFNLAYRMLGNPKDAEDAAQEAFLRAYARLKTFRAGEKFSTWLLAIAAHYCIDQLRRRRFQWLSLDDDAPWVDSLASDVPEPDAIYLRRENQAQIEKLVERLAPGNRLVIVLHYWYDLPLDQIARITGDYVNSIKVKLFRTRRALARELQNAPAERSKTFRAATL